MLVDQSAETKRLHALYASQRSAYDKLPMPDLEQRLQWLEALHEVIASHQQALVEAISADFGNRSADETPRRS